MASSETLSLPALQQHDRQKWASLHKGHTPSDHSYCQRVVWITSSKDLNDNYWSGLNSELIPSQWNISPKCGISKWNEQLLEALGDEEPETYWSGDVWDDLSVHLRWNEAAEPEMIQNVYSDRWGHRGGGASACCPASIGIAHDLLWNCYGFNVPCRWMSFANKRRISAPQSSFSVWASAYEISVQSPSTTRSGGGDWLLSLRLIWCFMWVERLWMRRKMRKMLQSGILQGTCIFIFRGWTCS